MAFTSIALDGYGLYAACDGLADSAGGDWAETGGGTVTYEVTDPLVGAGSIGIEYASKNGIVLFTSDITLNFTVGGNAEDQLIGAWIKIASNSAFETLANEGFCFVVGTDINNYRIFKLNSATDSNGWNTGWKYFVFDIVNTGDSSNDVGTFNLATINVMGLLIDTIVSVRAPTIFIDQIYVYNGIRVKGIGTLNEIVTYCTDFTSRAWGTFQEREGIYYAYGKLFVGDNTTASENTIMTDDGNVMQYGKSEYYHDTNGWSLTHLATYNEISLEKHASYTTDYTSSDTSLFGATGVELIINEETGAILTQTGGALKTMLNFNASATETLENKVLTNISASNIANIPLLCTWNISGLITVTGTLDTCTINKPTDTSATSTADLSNIDTCTFVKDTTDNHATTLTGAAGSYTWSSIATGYDLGTTGNDVEVTGGSITGNEMIHITAATGTFIINVAAGATVPSVSTAGAIVNVVAGAITLKMTVKDVDQNEIVGAYAYIDSNNVAPFILNTTTDVNGEASVSYSDGSVAGTTWRIRKYGYKPFVQTVDIAGIDISIPVTLNVDPQQT